MSTQPVFKAIVEPIHLDKYGRAYSPLLVYAASAKPVRYDRVGVPWTVHMCTPDRTEWNTDQAKQLNGAHYAFLSQGVESEHGYSDHGLETLSLEQYIEKILTFLSEDGSDQDALAFLSSISSELETGSFCPLDSKDRFAKRLVRAWHSYRKQAGLEPKIIRQRRVGPTEQYSDPVPARATAENIQHAYTNLQDGLELAENVLYRLLTKLASGIAFGELRKSPRCLEPRDELAQVGVIHVWNRISTFKGKPEQFYSWSKKVCWRAINTAVVDGCAISDKQLPYLIPLGDEDVEPALTNMEYRAEFQRELPDFIQGTDLKICMYIRAGYDYKEIARVLEVTEISIRKRIGRMRQKIQEMKGSCA